MNDECPKCFNNGKVVIMEFKTNFELPLEQIITIYQCPECKNVEVL